MKHFDSKNHILETKHDFCQITKVRDNKNHASSIYQLKTKLLFYEKFKQILNIFCLI
jgi:hypothetical protein